MTIAEYIEKNKEKLAFSETYQGFIPAKEWSHDLFSCKINSFEFPYKKWIGHRKKGEDILDLEYEDQLSIKNSPDNMILSKSAVTFGLKRKPFLFIGRVNKYYKNKEKYQYCYYHLNRPTLEECLSSLLSDYQCVAGYSFEDFCSNLGYNPDSIKALDIYNTILKNSNILSGVLPDWNKFILCEEQD